MLLHRGFILKLTERLQTRTLRSETSFGIWKLFKKDEKCFLFHLESSFRSQDIYILSCLFGHIEKRLDWKDKLSFKSHDVTTWLINTYSNTIIAIHILTNITRSKDNEAIKFGQLIEYALHFRYGHIFM